jgi:hypothetical protein
LKKCHLQLENLENLIFMSKSWPNAVRVGCKELDEFESSFEQEESNKG